MIINNAIFGELTFNTGWKSKTVISLFGVDYDVVVKIKAYFEADGITTEQEIAIAGFAKNKLVQLDAIEQALNDYANGDSLNLFVPRVLLFNRDGSYALLLDDSRDVEDGIAVTIAPNISVISQNEYL
ncbi:TPA: hypothetical protein ACRTM4_000992 [Aeromonas hydrophila]|uniref:DUF6985 domain-containing protein n=1 Tax=Aeromonas caviae TaxID=648 RepID=UPI002B252CED|nr:hypothetical protein [Aeromonas caviae]MEA9443432.1 hypothetical protein [Aeromonas caviae]